MIESALQKLGLTQGEMRVYLALVGLGETTTGPIVEQSGVSVSKVYIILDKLSHKGLASHVMKGKVRYFKAAEPEILRDRIRERQEDLALLTKEVEDAIPILRAKRRSALTAETAQVYDGLKGIQAARDRTLRIMKRGDEMWVVGIARTPYDRLTPYFAQYHERRWKKGITCNYLYNDYARTPFGETSASYPLSSVRYMPKGVVTHAWMEIYADTVTIGINTGKSFSVVLQNQEVADSFRAYAKLLWSIARPSHRQHRNK